MSVERVAYNLDQLLEVAQTPTTAFLLHGSDVLLGEASRDFLT